MISSQITKMLRLISIRGATSTSEILFVLLLSYQSVDFAGNTLSILSLIFIGSGCGKGLSEILLTKTSATDFENQSYKNFLENLIICLLLGLLISTAAIFAILLTLYFVADFVLDAPSIVLVICSVYCLNTALAVSEVHKSFEKHVISGLNHYCAFNFLNFIALVFVIHANSNHLNSGVIFIISSLTQLFLSLYFLKKLFVIENFKLNVISIEDFCSRISVRLIRHSLIRPTSIIFIWLIILFSQINIAGDDALKFAFVLKLTHFISFFVIVSDSYYAPKFSRSFLQKNFQKLFSLIDSSLKLNWIATMIIGFALWVSYHVASHSFPDVTDYYVGTVFYIFCVAHLLNLALGPSGIFLLMTDGEDYIQWVQATFLLLSFGVIFLFDMTSATTYALAVLVFLVGSKSCYLAFIFRRKNLWIKGS